MPLWGEVAIATCVECGQEKECQYDVDPYGYELYGDDSLMWMCQECAQQRAYDV